MRADESRRRRLAEHASRLGYDRLGVFVPAIMSVGLVFWIVTEIAEVLRARADESRRGKSSVAASAVADDVLGRTPTMVPGLRPRPVYLLAGATLLGIAIYVPVGSVANFFRPASYVEGIAWLLALASAAGFVALLYSVTAFTAWVTWPRPPAWVRGVLLRSPLGAPAATADDGHRPSWKLGALLAGATAATALLTMLVAWSPHIVENVNDELSEWFAAHDPLGGMALLEHAGSVPVTIAIALVAAVIGFRCRVLLVSYALSFVAALLLGALLRPLVAQAGEATYREVGELESFPSVTITLVVLVAGLYPLSLTVLFRQRWVVPVVRAVLGILALVAASHLIASGELPTDVVGGLLLGLVLVLASQWVVETQSSHASCDRCPWSYDPYHGGLRGAIPIHATAREALTFTARILAAAAATGAAVLALSIDAPGATQGLVVVAATGGAVAAWRWTRIAAALMVAAALGVGVLAAHEHATWEAALLTVAFLVPPALALLARRWARVRHDVPVSTS